MVDDHLTTTFGFFDVLYVIRKLATLGSWQGDDVCSCCQKK